MKQNLIRVSIASSLWCLAFAQPIAAQIVPDGTLPINSTVTPDGNRLTIEGGTAAGGNLFHSFQDFSLRAGYEAFFNNAVTIENVITRVTGENISQIDGLIRANGVANLFLVNPNGIAFGPNARLDIGGSFVGSSADRVLFEDGSFYDTRSGVGTEASPLLTVSVPVGLQFGSNRAGAIVNGGNLRVAPQQDLTLMGGTVVSTGELAAPGGEVMLSTMLSSEIDRTTPPDFAQFIQDGSELGLTVTGDRVELTESGEAIASGDIAVSHVEAGTATLNAAGNLILGEIIAQGQPLDFSAMGDITVTSAIRSGGGDIQLDSGGTIDTRSGELNSSLDDRRGGAIVFRAHGDISSASLISGGGDIQLESGGIIDTRSGVLNSRPLLSMSELDDVTQRGAIVLIADGDIWTDNLRSRGGDIRIESGGRIDTRSGVLESYPLSETDDVTPGGAIVLIADGDILTDTLLSRGGDIRIESGGSIDTSNRERTDRAGGVGVNTEDGNDRINGGSVFLRADGDIRIDRINVRGGAVGGSVFLRANGNIQLGQINTRSDRVSGNVTIVSGLDLFLFDGRILTSPSSGDSELGLLSSSGIGGDIHLSARNILLDGALIFTGAGAPGASAGNVTITATESVDLRGITQVTQNREGEGSRPSVISTSSLQNSGDITINAERLRLQDGALIATLTFLGGQGGQLTVNATESVELIGLATDEILISGLVTDAFGAGVAGNLEVNTNRLIVRDGTILSASAFSADLFEIERLGIELDLSGQGGNIIVNATESVEIRGTSTTGFPSGVYNQTFGSGNAGNLEVNTAELTVSEGGQITVSARTVDETRIPFAVEGFFEIFGTLRDRDIENLGLFLGVTPGATVTQTRANISEAFAQRLRNAQVTGNAGDIEIGTELLQLDGGSGIIAITNASEGGNITLNVRDQLRLRRNSQVSTTAGILAASGNGGNITIDTPLLVAIPRENSDISANAFEGNGGNVNIAAQGIFGTEFRQGETTLSDITASSQFGTDGTVTIELPDVDPASGLIDLPVEVVDPTSLVDERCRFDRLEGSEFINTGSGGRPPSPTDPLTSSRGWIDPLVANISSDLAAKNDLETDPLVEAQGWILNDDGQIELVVEAPTVTPYGSPAHPRPCQNG